MDSMYKLANGPVLTPI